MRCGPTPALTAAISDCGNDLLLRFDMTADDDIPECQGMMGASMIEQIMDGDRRTATY